MTVCAVNGCHSTSEKHKKDINITFHGFPSDLIIAARWTDKIRRNRNDGSWAPTKNTKICSLHFADKEKYITKGGLCRLRRGAVPTKNLPVFIIEEKFKSSSLECGGDLQQNQERNLPQPGTSDCDTAVMSPLSSGLDSIFDTLNPSSGSNRLSPKGRVAVTVARFRRLGGMNRRKVTTRRYISQ